MKQADLRLALSNKRTRRRGSLDDMNRPVACAHLVSLIAPYSPEGGRSRPPSAVEAMLRIDFRQQWLDPSDPVMEEALQGIPLYRDFARLHNWTMRLPDESTILRFRHLLEKHHQSLGLIKDILFCATRD